MAKSKSSATPTKPTPIAVDQKPDESRRQATARVFVAPFSPHGIALANVNSAATSGLGDDEPGIAEFAHAVKDRAKLMAAGDMTLAAEMLACQAITLDSVFTDMARRMAINAGQYLEATETYARIALKAQAGSRAALSELAKLHQPREQTVRHVHVNEGGQAVIAGEFHHHTGGQGNGQNAEQPHAPAGGAAGAGSALPSPDPIGPAMPIASRERECAVQNARGQGKRRAKGQS